MANQSHEKDVYQRIAYLADWGNWDGALLDVDKLTRINYAFALVSDHKITGTALSKVHWIRALKRRNPNLQALISIGGWGADGFSDAALTTSNRKLFADTALDFMIQYDFDGIDVDWEYPCRDFAKIVARPEDKQNFTLLLKALRDTLDRHSIVTGKRYLLTIATGASKMFADDMELDKVTPLLDSINLMTYDFYTVGPNPGHHTNLYPSQHDPKNSGHQAVRTFIEAGVPAEKIILGAAFYGRGWSGLKSDESPFGQKGQSGLSYPYSRICTDILADPRYRRYWDDAAKAPYLWNGDTFITYEDSESLHHKVEYIKDNGLGGIMFWEWSEDKDNALLHAIYDGFNL